MAKKQEKTIIKKNHSAGILIIIISLVVIGFLVAFTWRNFAFTKDLPSIKAAARRASVQVQFNIPVLKVSFTTPFEKEKEDKLTREEIAEMLDAKIKQVIETERELAEVDKYQSVLVPIDKTVTDYTSRTQIPLGALGIPKWAKFPERVIVVHTVEKKDIMPWEKESERDVLTISETTGVSLSKAREILANLRSKGYSVSKETITEKSEIKLIWYDDGWDDTWPITLDWKVSLDQKKESPNLIIDYDPRGILITKMLPEDGTVFVKAGYLDLKDEFKPKSAELERTLKEIEELKDRLKAKERELDRLRAEKAEKPGKRDISKATRFDLMMGRVKLEQFWMYSAASGVFLGNMKVREKIHGYLSWRGDMVFLGRKQLGIILTNAHVAEMGMNIETLVTEDKEIMYIILPGIPSIRYTQDSDMYGSPAMLVYYDDKPIISSDYDAALLATSAIPMYEPNKALLGDSDNVREGDPVLMVGNPMEMQKFSTEGIVSNKNYSPLKSRMADHYLAKGLSRRLYNWLQSSNWWFDPPIGTGGTSGSGVWALSGSEAGKVVALHNMGAVVGVSANSILVSESRQIDPAEIVIPEDSGRVPLLLSAFLEKQRVEIVDIMDYKDAKFIYNTKSFADQFSREQAEMLIGAASGYADVPGMNGAIPINPIKRFLQERGIDPEHFMFEGAKDDYWER